MPKGPKGLARAALAAATLLTTFSACSGEIGDPGSRGITTLTTGSHQLPDGTPTPGTSGVLGTASNTAPGGVVMTLMTPADPNAAGPRPITRLTHREYNNTVRDLLGETTNPADQFPPDKGADFLYHRAGLVAVQDADVLRTSAETLAQHAVMNLTTLLPCSTASGDDACAREFVTSFGKKTYRRPLSLGESDRIFALYKAGRTTLKLAFNDAIGVVIEAMLQSPAFLYHWGSPELSPAMDGDLLRLDAYDVASRLSYFIWGSIPDAELMGAADADKLATTADVQGQAVRMLLDPRARDGISAFFDDWLGLDLLATRPKDATVYPQYNDQLKAAMKSETDAFVQNVVFDGDGRLDTLLNAKFSFLNQDLNQLYGQAGGGGTFQKTPVDPMQRAGLLTQPSFLTVTGATDGSHPVRRGHAFYEKLLCGSLPPPPAMVPPPKPASAGGTTRQRFTEHDKSACATACHTLMDPFGFAFEHYDGIGEFRTMDNGSPVDSHTSAPLDGTAKEVNDAIELVATASKSTTVERCFATQFTRFALGRAETPADATSINSAAGGFAQPTFSVRDLVSTITATRSFRFRSPAAGEILQ